MSQSIMELWVFQTSNLDVFDPAGSSPANVENTITTENNYTEVSRRYQTPFLQHFYSVLVLNFNFINRTWSI